MRGINSSSQLTKPEEGPRDDQVMMLVIKKSLSFSLCLTSCICSGGTFVKDDEAEGEHDKGLPLKVGQHMYFTTGFLYYAL